MKNKIPKHFIKFFEDKGFSEVKLNDEFEIFKLDRKREDWKDFIWYKLQKQNFDFAKNSDELKVFYFNQDSILAQMIYLRRIYQNQKANELNEVFLTNRVEYMDCSNLQMKFAICPEARCSYAMQFKEQWLSKEEIKTRIKLLGKNCNHPKWCTCAIVSEAQRDKEGSLKRK